jgi:hypothetical protein
VARKRGSKGGGYLSERYSFYKAFDQLQLEALEHAKDKLARSQYRELVRIRATTGLGTVWSGGAKVDAPSSARTCRDCVRAIHRRSPRTKGPHPRFLRELKDNCTDAHYWERNATVDPEDY